jgi:hypothetical protein
MITLKTNSDVAGSLPALLRETSGCSYQFLDKTPNFIRRDSERSAFNGVGDVLSKFYDSHRAEYDALPKTKEEAALQGVQSFDGLQVSVCPFTDLDKAEIAPIRYSYLSAYQKCRKELLAAQDFSGVVALEQENPFILGAAVYAVTRYKGEPCIMMQIKGNALGKDQIHSALAAGGISMKEFQNAESINEMLLSAAVRQATEELGLPLKGENLGDPALLRLENATGNIGIGYILKGMSGSDIVDAYVEHATKRIIASSDDTARGVVLMPTQGIVMISLDGGAPALNTRQEIIVTKDGQITPPDESCRGLRPAAQGYLAALEDPDFLRQILERSGI